MMDLNYILALLAATIALGTPILLAASGELMTEKSGILNLGVEGMMLTGAVLGFIFAVSSGNAWVGILAAMLGGGSLAAIHAFISITMQGNQVVSGLALTIFGTGLSGFLGKNYLGVSIQDPFRPLALPFLSDIPWLGSVLFQQDLLVYASLMLALLFWYILYRTGLGLNIRAVGEDPAAADAVGINVKRVRYFCTILGGIMAGLGGAYLSLAYAPSWQENMTAGRGWIAVALVIFALWNPLRAILGAYLFGGIQALTVRLQTIGVEISPFFLNMLPYLLTIFVLVMVTVRKKSDAGAPRALSVFYDREER